MVTVPGEDRGVPFVRNFYEDHRTVIVIAQIIGLAAALAFLAFARELQRAHWVGRVPWVFVSGSAVTAAAVLAGVPPLLISVLAGSAGSDTISTLAAASDLTDVVLFAAIAAFAASVALAVDNRGVRLLSAVVALVCVARAVLLLTGGEALELAAPMAFIALVLGLAVVSWRSGQVTSP